MNGSVVGVDLGGTKVAAAALSEGELGASLMRPTDLSSSSALIDQLVELVGDVRRGRLDAVGVGVPSIVEFETGRVVSSINVPLADVPLRQVLGEQLGVPVFVDNDATVAALAEAHNENLRLVARDLVMLTIGSGVGGGLVLGGRIFRGSTGGAGELGHTVVGLDLDGQEEVPPPVQFPQPGSLEWVAAGRALDRFAAESAKSQPDSALARLVAGGRPPTGGDAVAAAQASDETARRTVEVWAEHVGIGIANAINTFDPDEVVIGGGAALAGELLLEPAARVARQYAHPGLASHATIRLARHGVRAGVLGAALLAVHELERAPEPSVSEERSVSEVFWPPRSFSGVSWGVGRPHAEQRAQRMIVACGFDHAGFPLRDRLVRAIEADGHEVLDLGTHSTEPIDYPDKALEVGRAVLSGAAERGILVCGSGAGVSVAASKVRGIRAATIHDVYTAHQAVEHDAVNVLCLGSRVIGPELAAEIVTTFLGASVSEEDRHVRRRAKIDAIERTGGQ